MTATVSVCAYFTGNREEANSLCGRCGRDYDEHLAAVLGAGMVREMRLRRVAERRAREGARRRKKAETA